MKKYVALAALSGLLSAGLALPGAAVTLAPLPDAGNKVGVRGGLFDLSIGAAATTPQTANGSFATYVSGPIEMGLRASLRYDLSGTPGAPQPLTNVVSPGVYAFSSFDGNAPAGQTVWNFDWWINTAYIDPTILSLPPGFPPYALKTLDDYYYQLTVTDPQGHSASRSPFIYPLGAMFATGATQELSASAAYGSENPGDASYGAVLGTLKGVYDVSLTLFAKDCVTFTFPARTECSRGDPIQTVSISVVNTDLPTSLPLIASGLAALAALRRRADRKAAVRPDAAAG